MVHRQDLVRLVVGVGVERLPFGLKHAVHQHSRVLVVLDSSPDRAPVLARPMDLDDQIGGGRRGAVRDVSPRHPGVAVETDGEGPARVWIAVVRGLRVVDQDAPEVVFTYEIPEDAGDVSP